MSLYGRKIKDDAGLVGVVGEPSEAAVRSGLVAGEWGHETDGVAARRLDLDDVRAQVCKEASGVLSGEAGEVKDADARQDLLLLPVA